MLDLVKYYKNKDYESFIKCFDKYIEDGYGFDLLNICDYIYSLIKLHRENYAYYILKNLVKNNELSDNFKLILSSYLYCCTMPIDAINVLESIKTDSYRKDYYLANNYMLAGRIDESKTIIEKMLSKYSYRAEEINELLKEINNYEKYGSFIETEYVCFCNLGGKLEPGYIIYLKDSNKINSLNTNEYNYINSRPYLIWKIIGDELYLYPITRKDQVYRYELSKDKYLNTPYNRYVKVALCSTNINNVRSVKDRLTIDDFNNALSVSSKAIINCTDLTFSQKKRFFRLLNDNINNYEMIKVTDIDEGVRRITYYFVLEVNDEEYKCVKIDNKLNVISDEVIYLNKNDIMIYDKKVLDEETKEKILCEIQDFNQIKLTRNIEN